MDWIEKYEFLLNDAEKAIKTQESVIRLYPRLWAASDNLCNNFAASDIDWLIFFEDYKGALKALDETAKGLHRLIKMYEAFMPTTPLCTDPLIDIVGTLGAAHLTLLDEYEKIAKEAA